ncbi:putative E3 ubiquitin ligase complex SCF subunit [Venturia nashicola]|uniref:Putative E3 ubiquitin ligase complex SCF subunit n=1 Tax=Venturia nashicola TaxID=86259 RepID=A0A4Z1PMI6_9PEZI|nr:putative E3 ubiquitin ligase complex SCF subunit [Venturia nashicola]TLD36383.1 putative E3 ubiquitin ligase complex SCF subunit [Venturia nashicola]
MRTQWLLLVIASSLFSVSYAQTTAAPTAATASKSELDSILGVGLSFVRSILSADPTTVTATYSPTSTLSTSSSSTSSTSTSSTPSSTSSRSTSSSTTLASQTSSSFSSSSIATASSLSTTPSAAAASAKPNDKGDSSNRKLAIILGSVLGSLALLSLIMFFCCLRRHRKKHPHDHIGYNHVEKNASSSRQSLAGKRNSSGTLIANSRSRSLSETRSINKDYRAMPSVPPPHRLSKNDATPYGALPISQRNSRHDPFHDRNVATPGRYYDPNTPPAHRTPPVPNRSPQQQSEYFPPYDAPRRSQESSPHSSFGSAKTLGDANHASASAGPSPPLQAQQKHRSLPRSSLANEFNFGFDGRDGSGGYGQDVPREFRRKSVSR